MIPRTYTLSELSHCSKRLQLPSGQLHPFCVGSHLLLAADALVAMPPRRIQSQCSHCSKRLQLPRGNCTHFLVGSHHSRPTLSRPPAALSTLKALALPASIVVSSLSPALAASPLAVTVVYLSRRSYSLAAVLLAAAPVWRSHSLSSASLPPLAAAAHVLVVYVALVPALPPIASVLYPYAHTYIYLTRC